MTSFKSMFWKGVVNTLKMNLDTCKQYAVEQHEKICREETHTSGLCSSSISTLMWVKAAELKVVPYETDLEWKATMSKLVKWEKYIP